MRAVPVLVVLALMLVAIPVESAERTIHPFNVWIPMDPMGQTMAVYEAAATPVLVWGEKSKETFMEFHNLTFGALAIVELPDGSQYTAPVVEAYSGVNDSAYELIAIFPNVDLTLAGGYQFKLTNGTVTLTYPLPKPTTSGGGDPGPNVDRCKVAINTCEPVADSPADPTGPFSTTTAGGSGGYCRKFTNDVWFDTPYLVLTDTADTFAQMVRAGNTMRHRAWAWQSWDGETGQWVIGETREAGYLSFSLAGKTMTGDFALFAFAMGYTIPEGRYDWSICPSDNHPPFESNSGYQPRVGIRRVDSHAVGWPDPSVVPASSRGDSNTRPSVYQQIALDGVKTAVSAAGHPYLAGVIEAVETLTEQRYGSTPYYFQTYAGELDETVWKYYNEYGSQVAMSVEVVEYLHYGCTQSRPLEFYGAMESPTKVRGGGSYAGGTPYANDDAWFGSHHQIRITHICGAPK